MCKVFLNRALKQFKEKEEAEFRDWFEFGENRLLARDYRQEPKVLPKSDLLVQEVT
jgi:hypothetical protein